MARSRIPFKARLQIAIICLGFLLALIAAGYFWSLGERPMVPVPLIGYTACVNLYIAYVRYNRQS